MGSGSASSSASNAPPLSAQAASDLRQDRRSLVGVVGVVGGAYALSAAVQAVYVYRELTPEWHASGLSIRIGVNLLSVAVLLAVLLAWGQPRRSGRTELVVGVLVAAVAMATVRVLVQVAIGVYVGFTRGTTSAEVFGGLLSGVVAGTLGTWGMLWRRDSRREARAALASDSRQLLAQHALEEEEIRVRRAVAEGLHGSVQQRLVLVVAQLDATLTGLAADTLRDDDLAALRAVRDDLDRMREQDVRETGRMLYPEQVDVGLMPAVRVMLRRVPSSIATRLQVDDAVRALDDPAAPVLGSAERLLAVRVIEEGIGNALRHGRPTSLFVRLALADDHLVLAVEDDGGGVGAGAGPASGTRRLAERLAVVGGSLELTGTPRGARLEGRLPVAALRR